MHFGHNRRIITTICPNYFEKMLNVDCGQTINANYETKQRLVKYN